MHIYKEEGRKGKREGGGIKGVRKGVREDPTVIVPGELSDVATVFPGPPVRFCLFLSFSF